MGILSKITRPITRVLDKIIPNEIKPALPFVTAALPFLAPGLGAGIGGFFTSNPMLARAIGSGALNLISQASQEGAERRGINPLSLGISSLTGALASPNIPGQESAAMQLRNLKDIGGFEELNPNLGILSQVKNMGLEGLAQGAEFLSKGVIGPDTPITGKQLLATAKAAAPGEVKEASEMAYNKAQDALDKYNADQAALGQMGVADQSKRRDAVIHAMQLSGFGETDINSALTRLGLADGGISFAQGGLMSLGGREMDFRDGGGFVPIGAKERADDVPARLSKNEFVFTAKAVRNAGGGDIRKGAKKMYQIMKQLEARA